MKTFAIVGKNKSNVKALKRHLLLHKFIYGKKKPDFIVSLGGDGTYLYAERLYPGIPKLLVRDSKICNKCDNTVFDHVITKLKTNQYRIEQCIKLDAFVNGKRRLTAANDIVLRNRHLAHAIRFLINVNNKPIDGELIGDGIVIATPYGSTAYFHSITRKQFASGIGIAFNNLTAQRRPLVVEEKATITITMTREDAELAADNDPQTLRIREGDVITIRKRKETAKIIKVHIGLTERFKRIKLLGRRKSM